MSTDKINENPLSLILNAIVFLTKSANAGEFKKENPPAAPERFTLEGLISTLLGINQDNFLTEAPLHAYLGNFSRGEENDNSSLPDSDQAPDAQLLRPVRQAIPEGARLTFAVLPCRINGLPLVPLDYDDIQNNNFNYFHVFYSDPNNKRGMAKTADCEEYAPYLMVIPQEFLDQCSFVVKYPDSLPPMLNERDPARDERDFLYFEGECLKIFRNIQSLLKTNK